MLESVSKENELFYQIVKPVRPTLTIEMMMKKQNYNGFDRKGFDSLVQKLDIQDPIQELLNPILYETLSD